MKEESELDAKKIVCNFCGKNGGEVSDLVVAETGSVICDECVGLALPLFWASMTKKAAKNRSPLRRMVREFHMKFGHPVRSKPEIPPEEELRFRAKLITEEYFEWLAALGFSTATDTDAAYNSILRRIEELPVQVNFPEMIDAQADLKYVIEGADIICGVQGGPIMQEVHRANMEKDAVYVQQKDGYHKSGNIKPVKPADWRGPQIEAELREQGWEKPTV